MPKIKLPLKFIKQSNLIDKLLIEQTNTKVKLWTETSESYLVFEDNQLKEGYAERQATELLYGQITALMPKNFEIYVEFPFEPALFAQDATKEYHRESFPVLWEMYQDYNNSLVQSTTTQTHKYNVTIGNGLSKELPYIMLLGLDFGIKKQRHFQGSLVNVLGSIAEFTRNENVVNVQPFQVNMLKVGVWYADIYYEEV